MGKSAFRRSTHLAKTELLFLEPMHRTVALTDNIQVYRPDIKSKCCVQHATQVDTCYALY